MQPDREDERARIEALGGKVFYWQGFRVSGVLAMSRSIGMCIDAQVLTVFNSDPAMVYNFPMGIKIDMWVPNRKILNGCRLNVAQAFADWYLLF